MGTGRLDRPAVATMPLTASVATVVSVIAVMAIAMTFIPVASAVAGIFVFLNRHFQPLR